MDLRDGVTLEGYLALKREQAEKEEIDITAGDYGRLRAMWAAQWHAYQFQQMASTLRFLRASGMALASDGATQGTRSMGARIADEVTASLQRAGITH